MVNAALIPLSSIMEQLLNGSHTVPNSAKPEKKKKKKIVEKIIYDVLQLVC